MANMNEFKSKANNAVTTGNAVLQDAERTLKTLQGRYFVELNSNYFRWKITNNFDTSSRYI